MQLGIVPKLLFYAAIALSSLFLALAVFLATRKCERVSEKRVSPRLVTVLVPVRNEPPEVLRRLAGTLRSLAEALPVEAIVVDDSSEEKAGTVRAALSGTATILHRASPRGFKPGALNDALSIAKGDVIVVIDADTELRPRVLIDMLSAIGAGYDYVQAPAVPSDSSTPVSWAYAVYEVFRNEFLLRGTAWAGTPMVSGFGYAFSKESLLRIGGWREDVLAEDAELSVRAARRGLRGALTSGKVRDLPPASLSDLRKQQQRWILGSFQALREAMRGVLRREKGSLFYSLVLAFYAGLLSNLLIGLSALSALFVGVGPSMLDVAVGTIPLNLLLIAFAFLLVRRAAEEIGLFKALVGAALGAALYNSLSLYALYALARAIAGLGGEWIVTGRVRRREKVDHLLYALTALFFAAALIAALKSALLLAGWIGGILASVLGCWALEVWGRADKVWTRKSGG